MSFPWHLKEFKDLINLLDMIHRMSRDDVETKFATSLWRQHVLLLHELVSENEYMLDDFNRVVKTLTEIGAGRAYLMESKAALPVLSSPTEAKTFAEQNFFPGWIPFQEVLAAGADDAARAMYLPQAQEALVMMLMLIHGVRFGNTDPVNWGSFHEHVKIARGHLTRTKLSDDLAVLQQWYADPTGTQAAMKARRRL